MVSLPADEPALACLAGLRRGDQWTKQHDGSWRRRQGVLERRFEEASARRGESDIFVRFQVQGTGEDSDAFFSRVMLAWAALRAKNPLLASTVIDVEDSSGQLPELIGSSTSPYFTYNPPKTPEDALACAQRTVHITNNATASAALEAMYDLVQQKVLNGPRTLLDRSSCLARLLICRDHGTQTHQFCMTIAHAIADGLSVLQAIHQLFALIEDQSLPTIVTDGTAPTSKSSGVSANGVSKPDVAAESRLADWCLGHSQDAIPNSLPLSTEDLYPSLPLRSHSTAPTSTTAHKARARWFWAISTILIRNQYRKQLPSAQLPRRLPPPGEAGEPNTVWTGVSFSQAETANLVKLSKLHAVSPSMLLYGILSVAMSNVANKMKVTENIANPLTIGFPISIRRYLDPAFPSALNDFAIRISFGWITTPNTPQAVTRDNRGHLQFAALRNARSATRQFGKMFDPVLIHRGRFLATTYLLTLDRLKHKMGHNPDPLNDPKGILNASMIGDVDRIIRKEYTIPSESPSSVQISKLLIGTRLHRGEGIFGEAYTFDGRLTFCLGYDDVCVDPHMVRGILDELENIGKMLGRED